MIKNIFLDAGYTLIYPKGFSWWFPINFFDFTEKEIFLKVYETEKYKEEFAKASQYLGDNPLLRDENEEYDVFFEFYKRFLLPFPELIIDEEKIKKITASMVFAHDRCGLYPDVKSMLHKWKSEGYNLGIISDTFPSLTNIFKLFEIYDYFDVFVMSCDHGVYKPHEEMYISALNPLKARGEECVFVDDSVECLEGAEKFSINPIQIVRSNNNYIIQSNTSKQEKYPKFGNLIEIDEYIRNIK
ncbi:MAG: HAD family hydrolase [Oscillospiraceae bacterium]|nr:HAD family hydrolase [Oscillospiraceae bacterium]